MIDVDWSSLMPKQKQEPRAAGAAMLRFTPGAVLLRAGVSKRLAGPELLEQVREVCNKELEDPKGESRGEPELRLGFVCSRVQTSETTLNIGMGGGGGRERERKKKKISSTIVLIFSII